MITKNIQNIITKKAQVSLHRTIYSYLTLVKKTQLIK